MDFEKYDPAFNLVVPEYKLTRAKYLFDPLGKTGYSHKTMTYKKFIRKYAGWL